MDIFLSLLQVHFTMRQKNKNNFDSLRTDVWATLRFVVRAWEDKNKNAASFRKRRFGAGDEARTRYLHLGKVALYRMSYTRNGHDIL